MRGIALFTILISFQSVIFSAVINVPSDYPTIQQAIDAAVAGDTVLVAPGTYVENIDFLGKGIAVKSVEGPGRTIIDGNQISHVVQFIHGESYDAALIGFTITNGHAYIGGGVFCRYSSKPTIIGNVVIGNTAQADGGGIVCYELGSAKLINNIITNNHASGYGGGIHCFDASPIVTNCTITYNTSNLGGGIYHCYNSNMIINNSIAWNNTASIGPDIWVGGPSPYPASTLTIRFSDVKGGMPAVYVTSGSTLIWGPGNIDSDPLFVDLTNNDFHLTFDSPCRGTGDNAAVSELFDFEGDPRISYGMVDMGADEFYTHAYYTGNPTPGGNVEVKITDIPGTTPVVLWAGSGIMDPPMKTMFGDWYLQLPVVTTLLLGSIPANGVLHHPRYIPLNYMCWDIPIQAIVGNQLTNLCVMEVE